MRKETATEPQSSGLVRVDRCLERGNAKFNALARPGVSKEVNQVVFCVWYFSAWCKLEEEWLMCSSGLLNPQAPPLDRKQTGKRRILCTSLQLVRKNGPKPLMFWIICQIKFGYWFSWMSCSHTDWSFIINSSWEVHFMLIFRAGRLSNPALWNNPLLPPQRGVCTTRYRKTATNCCAKVAVIKAP